MTHSEIIDCVLDKIGITRNQEIKLLELISQIDSKKIKIVSVCNLNFHEKSGLYINQFINSGFNKRFFSMIFHEDTQEKNEFFELIEMLKNHYLITKITFKTEQPGDSLFIKIKGYQTNIKEKSEMCVMCLQFVD